MKSNLRILVSAGDPSGDILLSKIVKSFRIEAQKKGVEVSFEGLAGTASQAEGVKLIGVASDIAVVGILEVLSKLGKIFGTLSRLSSRFDSIDRILCVDFPDFNLKLAELAKKKSIPVDFVIAPQVWAWRHQRTKKIKSLVEKVYPALAFEAPLLREHGINAEYLGHPMRDLLEPRSRRQAREDLGILPQEFLWLWMPGSRSGEISRHLSLFLEAYKIVSAGILRGTFYLPFVKQGQTLRIIVPMAPSHTEEKLLKMACLSKKQLGLWNHLRKEGILSVSTHSHKALMAGDFGWICSGTATLEAAYYQLPHILVYKLKWLSAFMIKSLSDYFQNPRAKVGLPNILLEKEVIPELLQSDLTPKRLALESIELLGNNSRLALMKKELRYLPKKMGDPGVSERIARDLVNKCLSLS